MRSQKHQLSYKMFFKSKEHYYKNHFKILILRDFPNGKTVLSFSKIIYNLGKLPEYFIFLVKLLLLFGGINTHSVFYQIMINKYIFRIKFIKDKYIIREECD